MKRTSVFVITLCSVILMSQSVLANDAAGNTDGWDVIVLKNGNRIQGLIVEEDGNKAVVERTSARKDRFYTATIAKNDIAKILRLAPELRASLRRRRSESKRSERTVQEQAADQARQLALARPERQIRQSFRPIENRAFASQRQAQPVSSRAGMGGYGGGGLGGFGGGGLGGRGGGGMGGFGGGGMGGFGGGGMGGRGGGGMGGFGGGGMGGRGGGMGGATFSNIMQLFVPVNHALVGEVEPVIGLTGQLGAVGR